MAERQITVGKITYPLPELFMVMATQNPIEQEGTYPLPEAQLDRFLFHVALARPDVDEVVEDEHEALDGGGHRLLGKEKTKFLKEIIMFTYHSPDNLVELIENSIDTYGSRPLCTRTRASKGTIIAASNTFTVTQFGLVPTDFSVSMR